MRLMLKQPGLIVSGVYKPEMDTQVEVVNLGTYHAEKGIGEITSSDKGWTESETETLKSWP